MATAPEGLFADPELFSPSIFLDLPPTPGPDGSGENHRASSDDLVLPFISRMLMEEDIDDDDDDFFYRFPDHPALLQAQEPYARILSDAAAARSSDTTTSTASDSAAALSLPFFSDDQIQLLLSPPRPAMAGLRDFTADDVGAAFLDRSQLGAAGDASAFVGGQHDGSTGVQSSAAFFPPNSDSNSTASDSAATLSPPSVSDDPIQLLRPGMVGLHDFTADDVGAAFTRASPGFEQSRSQKGAAGDAGAFVGGQHDGSTGGQSSAAFLDNNANEQSAVLASDLFSSGQNGGNMDMLSTAFLKGMEEASKFLPTTDSNLLRAFAAGQEQEGRGNGNKGHKNRVNNGDDLEAETCRKSKLMVPEPEETGQMVDEMIVNGLELCLQEMEALRITMGSEAKAKKNAAGKKGKGKKSAQGRRSADTMVDLSTMLIHCAQAVATDNRRSAAELLKQIKLHSSPRGDATERLAHCFAEGLEARLAGSGSEVYRSLMAERTSVMDYLKAYHLYLAACCFIMIAFKFSNMTICKVMAGRKKVHIVDYGIQYGFQWPSLLGNMATWKGGPPQVRITGIDLPRPGFRPAARIEETGRRLSDCARHFGVPFKFHGITARWETIRAEDLDIDPDEVLIVNSIHHFGNLMDEGADVDSPSPRDVVLSNIREMNPDAFILFIMNASYSAPFFLTRFREALFFYSALFDMLDATAPRDNHQRFLVERGLFRKCALNIVACEGLDRVERPDTYRQWQVRNRRAGLRQLPLDPDVVKAVRERVREQYHKDFVIDVDHQWLLEGWKGRILYAMSTWVADHAI